MSNFFNKLFGKTNKENETNNKEEIKDEKVSRIENESKKDTDWYFNKTKDGKISQLVITVPSSSVKETEFGMLVLPFDNFPMLCSQPWCAGFLRMTEKPNPYLMLRVDEFDEDVKNTDLTVAISFCKLSTDAIFLVSIRLENPSISNRIYKKFSYIPQLKKPILEWVCSLSEEYSVKMMQEIFSDSKLKVLVANSEGANTNIMHNDGKTTKCLGPRAHHERELDLKEGFIDIYNEELESLIKYFKSIPSSKKNFQNANMELGKLMPFDKDPIITYN